MGVNAWAANLLLTAVFAWLLFLAWGAGSLLLTPFRSLEAGRLERGVLSLGLGLGAISFAVLGMGLAGAYGDGTFAALLALLSLAALLALRRYRSLPRSPGGREKLSIEETVLLSLLLTGVAATWLTALPTPIFYDALVYHLGVPNLYLLRGGIEALPGVVHSNFPFGMEMLYTLGIWLGGLRLAGLLNFGMGALSILALFVFVERHWGRSSALAAAALYGLLPMTVLLSRYASSETGLSFYFLLTVICLFRWREEEKEAWVFLAGLFGGLAAGTKYAGIVFAVFLPALFLVGGLFVGGGGKAGARLRAPAIFLSAAAAALLPWAVKNVLFTGNPLYPAFAAHFSPESWSPLQARALAASAHALWVTGHSWKEFLLLPWHLAAADIDLGAASRISPFWIVLIPAALALAVTARDWKARALVLLLAGYALLWASTFWMARFLLPAAGLGGAAVVLALGGENPSRRRARGVLAAVILLSLFHGVVIARDVPTRRTLPRALGMTGQQEYLGRLIRVYRAAEFINNSLPAESRILVLGETRVAFLRRDHLFQTALDRPILGALLAGSAGAEGTTASLSARGITHVLVNMKELKRLEGERRALFTDDGTTRGFLAYLKEHGHLLLAGNEIFLFRLPRPGP